MFHVLVAHDSNLKAYLFIKFLLKLAYDSIIYPKKKKKNVFTSRPSRLILHQKILQDSKTQDIIDFGLFPDYMVVYLCHVVFSRSGELGETRKRDKVAVCRIFSFWLVGWKYNMKYQ